MEAINQFQTLMSLQKGTIILFFILEILLIILVILKIIYLGLQIFKKR